MKLFFAVLFFFQIAWSQKLALFWGGGGEPQDKASTIFDSDYRAFVPGLVQKGWQIRPLFGVGHAHTEALVNQLRPHTPNRAFTTENALSEIAAVKMLAAEGQLSKVLLIVSSHGSEPVKNRKAHQVMATDVEGRQKVDLIILQDLQKFLEEKKIPFSIVDLSCYSGATLDLASAGTCVVSSSSAQEYSYSSFAKEFSRELLWGKNFEEAYLKARHLLADFSSPEISTPENSVIKSFLAGYDLTQFPTKKSSFCSSCEIHSRLKKYYEIEDQNLDMTKFDVQAQSQFSYLLRARSDMQEALRQYGRGQISYGEMDAVKIRTLNQHFSLEKQLYRKIYTKIQKNESHPCRSWTLD